MQHLHIHAKHSFSLWGMPPPGLLFLFSGCLSTETQMWSAALMIEGELQHLHWPGCFGWCIGLLQDMQSPHICQTELRQEWGTIAIVENAKSSDNHYKSSGELCCTWLKVIRAARYKRHGWNPNEPCMWDIISRWATKEKNEMKWIVWHWHQLKEEKSAVMSIYSYCTIFFQTLT